MPNQSLVRGQISELVHLAPIKQGEVPGRGIRYADRLRTTLEAFNARDAQGFPSVIRLFRGIHAAQWALVDGDTRLLLSVVFDGTLHGYLRALARDIPGMLHMIWSNCEGWVDPRDDGQYLIDFIERHQVRANFFFAQHPQLTVPDVEALLRLRDVAQQGGAAPALQAELYRASRPISNAKRLEGALAQYGNAEPSKQAFEMLFRELYTPDELARAIVETYGGAPAEPAPHARDQRRDAEIQGNVLAEYADAHCARMIFFRFWDPASARHWLHSLRGAIQFGREVPSAPYYLNVGFTHQGLAALGVSAAVLSEFPDAFVEGMEARAALLDDPAGRKPQPRPWTVVQDPASPVHVVVFLHARVEEGGDLYQALIDAGEAAQANAAEGRFESEADAVRRDARLCQLVAAHLDERWEQLPAELRPQLGAARRLGHQDLHRPLAPSRKDSDRPYGVEYFGFRDGIGQPQEYEPVLRPEGRGLLANASFLVARKLLQHPTAFWQSMADKAGSLNVTKRELAEQLVGRRMDGRRLDSIADDYHPERDRHAFDPQAKLSGCPFHSHVRRANPRVENNLTRNPTLMRRSLAYLDARQAQSARGLMFLAFNADIETQFELIQRNWLQAGNQVGLAARDRDVLTGLAAPSGPYTEHGPARFYAELPDEKGVPSQVARELQFEHAFVELEWGLYLYFPARLALNQL